MKTDWLGKVLGEAAPSKPTAKAPTTVLNRVLGEDEVPAEPSEPVETPDATPPAAAAPPPPEEGAVPAEPGGPDQVSNPVQALASMWTSGGKMDVALKLLTEPTTYGDFVSLVQAIGPEGALELGHILDTLSQGEGEGEEAPTDNVLSRVSDFQSRRHSPEEEQARDFRERAAEGDVDAINQAENP